MMEIQRDWFYWKCCTGVLSAATDINICVYNVANGNQISLNDLFYEINENLKENGIVYDKKTQYLPFRREI